METKIQQEVNKVLKTFPQYWHGHTLMKNKLIEDIRSYNEKIIEALLSNELIRDTYSFQLQSGAIFKVEEFISILRYKNYWDNSYTKYTNEIGLTSENKYLKYNTDVVLDFPHKDGILEGGMSKEEVGKKEIYYHNIIAKEEIDTLLSPKVLSNIKKYDRYGSHDSEFIDENDNLIIQGNNLLALNTLKNKYNKKIKLIYIDPPYYFESKKKEDTFKYNSNFKLSTWLVFMKNRLEIARELLSDDGAIFVQISDDGVAELHRLMKDIFSKEQNNFINKITVRTKSPSGFASVNAGVFETAEYILSFAKDKSKWDYNPQYVESSYDDNYKYYIKNKSAHHSKWEIVSLNDYIPFLYGYKNKKEFVKELGNDVFFKKSGDFALENADSVFRYTAIANNASQEIVELRDISKKESGSIFEIKRKDHYDVYIKNGQELAFYSKKIRKVDGKNVPSIQLSNMWLDTPYEGISREGGVTLKGGKKPEKLIKRVIEMATNKGDFVLDFFGGSGTTASVAHKLQRQYITIEQLDYKENSPRERLKNVLNGKDQSGISKIVDWRGGGSFIYTELHNLNRSFVHKIQESKGIDELMLVIQEMKDKAYLNFKVDLEKVTTKNEDFKSLSLEEQKEVLIQVLDMNQLYLNYSEIEDSQYDISDSVRAFNHSFYQKVGDEDE